MLKIFHMVMSSEFSGCPSISQGLSSRFLHNVLSFVNLPSTLEDGLDQKLRLIELKPPKP